MQMKKQNKNFPGCWYCDNIVDYPEQIGLLHLGFPRCFVLIPNQSEFFWSDYNEFRSQISEINWLDPNDMGTPHEQEEVLTLLWNFSIAQERMEEQLYEQESF